MERFGDDSGQACLVLWGSPLDVQALWQVVDRLAGPTSADDPRSLANRRFDAALGTLLDADPRRRTPHALTDDGVAAAPVPRVDPDPELQIVVDLATLAGLADHPGELAGYGPIPAGVVRDWLCPPSTWRRLVSDPVTGHLLDAGPAVRFAPPRLDRFVRTRDRHGVFPGCRHPARRADLDHRPAWTGDSTGGSTSARQASPCSADSTTCGSPITDGPTPAPPTAPTASPHRRARLHDASAAGPPRPLNLRC